MSKEDTTTLGTFRIGRDTWKSFQEKAKADGQNASALLNRFIRQYLEGAVDIESPTHLESNLEARIEEIARSLEARIAALETKAQEESKFAFLGKQRN
jgi:flagellar motor component MotA